MATRAEKCKKVMCKIISEIIFTNVKIISQSKTVLYIDKDVRRTGLVLIQRICLRLCNGCSVSCTTVARI